MLFKFSLSTAWSTALGNSNTTLFLYNMSETNPLYLLKDKWHDILKEYRHLHIPKKIVCYTIFFILPSLSSKIHFCLSLLSILHMQWYKMQEIMMTETSITAVIIINAIFTSLQLHFALYYLPNFDTHINFKIRPSIDTRQLCILYNFLKNI